MANAISKMLAVNLDTITKYGSKEALASLGIDGEAGIDKGKVNKAISDACSTSEAKEYLDALGTGGRVGTDSLTLTTGKVNRAAGYKISPAWAWAKRVNTLARTMEATLA